jgi:hypothetical protein
MQVKTFVGLSADSFSEAVSDAHDSLDDFQDRYLGLEIISVATTTTFVAPSGYWFTLTVTFKQA